MGKAPPANSLRELLAGLPARPTKPRTTGLTVVIDKHLGVDGLRDFIAVAGPYVDAVKLTSATSLFYDEEALRAKIRLLRDADIEVMPGGTIGEVMLWRGLYPAFLARVRELGFTGVEVSDGTIEMDAETRKMAIGTAAELGFKVVAEVGRKEWAEQGTIADLVADLKRDLALGADKVIIEAMEFGRSVGIVDDKGQVSEEGLAALVAAAGGAERIIWEAPLRQQQELFIARVGANANLGNIPPQEALVVEATRLGLTGIPFAQAYARAQGAQASGRAHY